MTQSKYNPRPLCIFIYEYLHCDHFIYSHMYFVKLLFYCFQNLYNLFLYDTYKNRLLLIISNIFLFYEKLQCWFSFLFVMCLVRLCFINLHRLKYYFSLDIIWNYSLTPFYYPKQEKFPKRRSKYLLDRKRILLFNLPYFNNPCRAQLTWLLSPIESLSSIVWLLSFFNPPPHHPFMFSLTRLFCLRVLGFRKRHSR